MDKYENEIYKTVQQMMNAAKEKKELIKQIQSYEKQLEDFFDEHRIKQFQLPIGVLKRTESP